MKDLQLWQFIHSRLVFSEPVILLCVVESHGSSPGRQGFKMAVANDGMFGSIGGGAMEYKFVELAKNKLQSHSAEALLRKQYHDKSAAKDRSGMICSGEQTIVIFQLSNKHLDTVSSLIASLQSFGTGTLEISPENFSFSNKSEIDDFFFQMNTESDWLYRERTGYKNHLYIIGGGHCALAFSQLMSAMDFYIHLFEDRAELNTFLSNNIVHEKVIVGDYSELAKLIPSGKNNYVVAMTFGFHTDDIVVRALIEKDFKYFGVLGSKTKISKLMDDWRRDNLPEHKLKMLHAPVGLSIHSQTPMEIAVSIAGEIISVRNNSNSLV